jgi:hypothetical protein
MVGCALVGPNAKEKKYLSFLTVMCGGLNTVTKRNPHNSIKVLVTGHSAKHTQTRHSVLNESDIEKLKEIYS